MITVRELSVSLLALSVVQVSSLAFADNDRLRPARNYETHEITLNGEPCSVHAIDAGSAVGECRTPDQPSRAFIWTQATGAADIGTLGGSSSVALAVDGRRVVGYSTITGDTETHAFSWTSEGGMLDLGTLGGNSARATSVSGEAVVGESLTTSGNRHAFLWTPASGMIDLPTLAAGDESSAFEIHGGLIAGISATDGNSSTGYRPVAWKTDGQLIDIIGEPIEPGENGIVRGYGEAIGVRNGLVIGHRLITPELTFRAFAWREGQGLIDLGLIPGSNESVALDTDGRWVVGEVSGRAFVWSETSAIAAITPATLTARATHVSNGRVVGMYRTRRTDLVRPFLWARPSGLVDVTPLDFPSRAVPTGIDADGRIAIVYADEVNIRSAVLIPKGTSGERKVPCRACIPALKPDPKLRASMSTH